MRFPKIGALDLRRPGLMKVRYDMWTADAELADAHRWLDAVLPSWAAGRSCAVRARLHDLEVHHGFQLARGGGGGRHGGRHSAGGPQAPSPERAGRVWLLRGRRAHVRRWL